MQSRVRQFMDLPLELRLMIWNFALRPLDPARPGAHFFSVVNNREDDYTAARISTRCQRVCNRCSNHYCSKYHLAAPDFDSSQSSYSWTKKNPSAYTWDFGMWSACRESRQAIVAHYRKKDGTTKIQRYYSPTIPYNRASISLVLPRNHEKWRFVFHPKQDLVCLQAFDPSTIRGWADQDRNDLCIASNAPSCFGVPKISGASNVFAFGNIAMAFDPSWNDIREEMDRYNIHSLYREQSARGFFIRTLAGLDDHVRYPRQDPRPKERPTLWLIDYNLKRVRYPNKKRKGRKVFYGNGQTFTEVDKSLSRRSFSSGEHSSALEFLDTLEILLDGDAPGHCMWHTLDCDWCNSSPVYRPRYQIHREVHVLMCEEEST